MNHDLDHRWSLQPNSGKHIIPTCWLYHYSLCFVVTYISQCSLQANLPWTFTCPLLWSLVLSKRELAGHQTYSKLLRHHWNAHQGVPTFMMFASRQASNHHWFELVLAVGPPVNTWKNELSLLVPGLILSQMPDGFVHAEILNWDGSPESSSSFSFILIFPIKKCYPLVN